MIERLVISAERVKNTIDLLDAKSRIKALLKLLVW